MTVVPDVCAPMRKEGHRHARVPVHGAPQLVTERAVGRGNSQPRNTSIRLISSIDNDGATGVGVELEDGVMPTNYLSSPRRSCRLS